MSPTRRAVLRAASWWLCASLLACRPGPAPERGCSSDAECPARSHCGPGGVCVGDVFCTADADCCVAERCLEGACRPRLRCTDPSTCALPSSSCVAGVCARARCEADGDCAQGLRCLLGVCADATPCGGPCPSGQACAARVDRCVPASTPTCAPGKAAVVQAEESTWLEGCSPAVAGCLGLPPVAEPQPGLPGRLLAGGDALFDVGYDPIYGDVVITRRGLLAPHDVLARVHVAGVPPGPVVGDPSGPRQGIAAPGPNVGAVLAVTGLAEGGLLVAATEAGAGVRLIHVAPDLTVVANQLLEGGEPTAMALRVASDGLPRLVRFVPAAAGALARLTLATGPVPQPGNPGVWKEEVLLASTPPAATSAPFARLPAGRGAMLDLTTTPDGEVWVAAYDADAGDLAWVRRDAAGVTVEMVPRAAIPGEPADFGRFPSIARASDGSPAIACLDHTEGRLLLLRRHADGWHGSVVDDGGREDGHHAVGAGARLRASGAGWLVAAQDARLGQLVVHQTDDAGVSQAQITVGADGTAGFAIDLVPLASKALVAATSGMRLGADGAVRVTRALVDVVIGAPSP
ncbi:MAG: hypothetical protein RIT45_3801 [Pseudomonadota bacterium]